MRYTDRAEFLSVNPDCCATAEAGPKGNVPDFLTRITGGFSGFVRLRFVARLKMEDSDVRLLPREEFYAISNCGKVWDGI